MKKLLLFLAIFPMVVFCQIPDTIINKKLSIGLCFSPDYCYRKIVAGTSNSYGLIKELMDSLEIAKFGFTTGLSFIYNINKRINIEAGFQYSDKGKKTKPLIIQSEQPDPTLPKNSRYIYSYRYFDIPIKANYLIFAKKLKLFISGGLSTNIFLSNYITSIDEYEDGTTKVTTSKVSETGISKVNIALIVGFGIDFSLFERLHVRLEPIYRRSINSNIDGELKHYFWSAGLNIGLYYKF